MLPMTPPAPKAVAVEVVAARPSEADRDTIKYVSSVTRRDEVYLVKVRLEAMPPPTAIGWALYLDDYRVPKYWAYKEGVY